MQVTKGLGFGCMDRLHFLAGSAQEETLVWRTNYPASYYQNVTRVPYLPVIIPTRLSVNIHNSKMKSTSAGKHVAAIDFHGEHY